MSSLKNNELSDEDIALIRSGFAMGEIELCSRILFKAIKSDTLDLNKFTDIMGVLVTVGNRRNTFR